MPDGAQAQVKGASGVKWTKCKCTKSWSFTDPPVTHCDDLTGSPRAQCRIGLCKLPTQTHTPAPKPLPTHPHWAVSPHNTPRCHVRSPVRPHAPNTKGTTGTCPNSDQKGRFGAHAAPTRTSQPLPTLPDPVTSTTASQYTIMGCCVHSWPPQRPL